MDRTVIAAAALVVACLLDFFIGDPPRLPHPVRVLGIVIALLEKKVRRFCFSPGALRVAGAVMVIIVTTGAVLGTVILLAAAYHFYWLAGFVLEVYILFAMLAGGDLRHHLQRVEKNLNAGNLKEARFRTSLLVSRDTAELDERGLSRAALESLFENSADGLVAPLLFAAVGGPAGAVLYKTVNTFDSMIGYKNSKYIDLGWFAARADDLLSYIPARLGAILVILAGLPGGGFLRGLKVLQSDHRKHDSPNSAWPEAAAAGILNVQLGGVDFYRGRRVERPLINSLGEEPSCSHLKSGLMLYVKMSLLTYILLVAFSWWLRTLEVGLF